MGFDQTHVDRLLQVWPRLRRLPAADDDTWRVAGPLAFEMSPPDLPNIQDCYEILVEIPRGAQAWLPRVYETGGRIPHAPDQHVNPSGTLCLGSPWTLRIKLGTPPSLLNYVDHCVVPFLYAASYRASGYGGFPFSELAHGTAGLLEDYERILGITGAAAVRQALQALSVRKRHANRNPCPCGCKGRLGQCEYRRTVNALRQDASRKTFRNIGQVFAGSRRQDVRGLLASPGPAIHRRGRGPGAARKLTALRSNPPRA